MINKTHLISPASLVSSSSVSSSSDVWGVSDHLRFQGVVVSWEGDCEGRGLSQSGRGGGLWNVGAEGVELVSWGEVGRGTVGASYDIVSWENEGLRCRRGCILVFSELNTHLTLTNLPL